jgi:glyoxylase-like metal-dependent hydrolase (beta-lactamase superfamily II)
MTGKNHKPIKITTNFFQLGTPAFPVYLSMGEVGLLIEGGTGPTFNIVIEQIKQLGLDLKKIQYVLLTHTHADHIGAVPHLKRSWPHLRLLASPAGERILKSKELFKEFLVVDLSIAQLMKVRSEVDRLPAPLDNYGFEVDEVIKGDDRIDLGAGVVWHILETPGHSPCHLSLFEEKEAILVAGDATGFYVPEKNIFWPNYFYSLEAYCDSLRRLYTLPAKIAALSHNGVIPNDIKGYLQRSMTATRHYHEEMLQLLARGLSKEKVALEKARFVDSLTDIQPFKVMYDLCRLLIKQSQTASPALSFALPEAGWVPAGLETGAKSSGIKGKRMKADRPDMERSNPLTIHERLGLLALIDEGMRDGLAEAPVLADLFSDLWSLVEATVSGSHIDRFKPNQSLHGFQVLEINAESGENLGRLNMLYLKKPLPCYYLVYVEVAAPFRKRGLGNRILKYFSDFLVGGSAIGLLDNIIPSDDPTFDIYLKHSWKPIETVIGNTLSETNNNYMIFIPPDLEGMDLKEAVLKLLYHLKRKRTVIDMKDNELMVRRTIGEFKDLYNSLLTYFEREIKLNEASPIMRYMFTRYVTKLIAFRRRITNLVGYTGGESMEQITLSSGVATMKMKSYAPREITQTAALGSGELILLGRLPEDLKNHPARVIESLPNYRRPSFTDWLEKQGKSINDFLTIGDLWDLGFDPTRLKEITINGQEYIFERVPLQKLEELQKKNKLLERFAAVWTESQIGHTKIKTNPVLLIISDRGNGYLLRRKIGAIHWEEAVEQLQGHPALQGLNSTLFLDRMIQKTVGMASEFIASRLGLDKERLLDQMTLFVPWDLKSNRPKMIIEFEATYLESVWLA